MNDHALWIFLNLNCFIVKQIQNPCTASHINVFFISFSFWIVNDETDSESVKLRIREPNNEKPPPKPIQLKIRKNWTELVCRRIYILTWIRNYDQTTAYSDFIAGVTLGLTMIPQAIAYASIAGMDPHYGLYAAFIGTEKWTNLKWGIWFNHSISKFRGICLHIFWHNQRSINRADIIDGNCKYSPSTIVDLGFYF